MMRPGVRNGPEEIQPIFPTEKGLIALYVISSTTSIGRCASRKRRTVGYLALKPGHGYFKIFKLP